MALNFYEYLASDGRIRCRELLGFKYEQVSRLSIPETISALLIYGKKAGSLCGNFPGEKIDFPAEIQNAVKDGIPEKEAVSKG